MLQWEIRAPLPGVITLSLDGETPVDIVIEWEIPALEDEPQPSLPHHPSIPGGSDSELGVADWFRHRQSGKTHSTRED